MKALGLAAVALAGCAFIAKGQVAKYERRVETYEKLAPDAEALKRGDVRTTQDMLTKMMEWSGYIEQQQLPPVDRQRLVDRLAVAQRKYLLAAAPLANTPDLGYALAQGALTASDAESLAIVRKLSDARAARRQQLFATTHTYSTVKDGETEMKTVASGMSVSNGQVTNQYSSSRLELKDGNCVFATRAFEAEGTPNPGLVFRITGKEPVVYVRCYFNRDILGLPDRQAQFVVEVSGRSIEWHINRPAAWPANKRYFDFVLGRGDLQPFVDPRVPFAALRISLAYEYSGDNVVVWVDGAQRVRRERPRHSLSDSPVFWDRDG